MRAAHYGAGGRAGRAVCANPCLWPCSRLPTIARQVAELGAPYVLMHMRGEPATMQARENTAYADVCAEVGAELQATAARAVAAGVEPWRIVLDPGAALLCFPKP